MVLVLHLQSPTEGRPRPAATTRRLIPIDHDLGFRNRLWLEEDGECGELSRSISSSGLETEMDVRGFPLYESQCVAQTTPTALLPCRLKSTEGKQPGFQVDTLRSPLSLRV